ncbi:MULTISPECIES: hypothetical protein [unclassified Rathayibacter]|uniref:hypothetical protein n=1 Tax=unclassified Rathayibacter TaxID=2609250 RepID=UPI0006F88BFE|nr:MULTISPECIES: hypothetical protein [unclassified Rathayibacter]KQQ03438.1 hypothetical protein ASF42_07915 [Rathayibacter sp. Leaf294]KQS11894.1 hypothetical protein ASG06_07915 [Rathayibacter sp. Leaf185]
MRWTATAEDTGRGGTDPVDTAHRYRIPSWISTARKDPGTGFIGASELLVGSPGPNDAGRLLTVWVDGEAKGDVVATTPPTLVCRTSGDESTPLVVESMEELLALLDHLRQSGGAGRRGR